MSSPKFLTKKFMENAVRFVVYFLCVSLTFLPALPLAHLFDWVAYSQLYKLFVEIFTVLLWGVEAWAIYFAEKAWKKRKQTEETPTDKPKEKQAKSPLPLKNLGILTAITAVCIFSISAIIGFKVKPVYDIGEKFTGYEMWCTIGVIGRNAFKCMWTVAILKACLGMSEELVSAYLPSAKPRFKWWIACGLLLIFGIFDIFTSVISYPMGGTEALTAIAYFLFYIAFTAIYYYAEENAVKAYLLIMFIYLF